MLEVLSYIPFKDFQVLSSKARTHQMAKMAASQVLTPSFDPQGGVFPNVASSFYSLICHRWSRFCFCDHLALSQ